MIKAINFFIFIDLVRLLGQHFGNFVNTANRVDDPNLISNPDISVFSNITLERKLLIVKPLMVWILVRS